MKHRFLLLPLLLAVLADPAAAGIFKKAPKPDPKMRVNELIVAVKTDKDESKRAAAAAELREYDPKAFPDIVPILIDVLMNDPKPSVRAEAAQSLGKLRPVTMEAGWALEQAAAKDSSIRVRMQAKSSLLQYHWAGYRAPKDGPIIENKEPPVVKGLLDPKPAPPPRLTPQPAPMPRVLPAGNRTPPADPRLIPTNEPPLLDPPPSRQQGPSLDPPPN
jgi:hypothetical protein